MHTLKWVFIFFSFGVNTSYSQKAEVEIPGTEIIKFKSAINNQDYVLNIYLPTSYNDTTKKFSVLYVLDGQWSFPYIAGVQGIAEGLFYDGLIPEMIVVGITWTDNYKRNDDVMTVIRINSHIYITFPGGKVKLYAKTADTFYGKGFENGFGQFVKDNSGKVIGYNLILDKTTTFYNKIN